MKIRKFIEISNSEDELSVLSNSKKWIVARVASFELLCRRK